MSFNQVDLSSALEDVQQLLRQRHTLRSTLASSATQLTSIASTAKHRRLTKRQVSELFDQNRKRKVENESLSADCERLRRELQQWTERHEALQHQTSCSDMYLQDIHAEMAEEKKRQAQQRLRTKGAGGSPSAAPTASSLFGSPSSSSIPAWSMQDNALLTEQLREVASLTKLVEESQKSIAVKRELAKDMIQTLRDGEEALREKSALLEKLEDELERRQEQREEVAEATAAAAASVARSNSRSSSPPSGQK
jgi:hypothetical protein